MVEGHKLSYKSQSLPQHSDKNYLFGQEWIILKGSEILSKADDWQPGLGLVLRIEPVARETAVFW